MGDAMAFKLLRRLFGLMMAKLGQPGIDDPRINPRGGEVQVEFALAMTQQDHGRGLSGAFLAAQCGRHAQGWGPPKVCVKIVQSRDGAYVWSKMMWGL